MSKKSTSLQIALAVAGLLAASQSMALSKDEYNSGKDRIKAEYKVDKDACDALKNNEKDVCVEQAKGKESIAKAELEHAYTGKEADRIKALEARADANYAVAKERCDDQSGNGKDVCVKEAKATHVAAIADAKAIKKIGQARKDAAEDKRDADYKVAIEKCDALSGDAKSSCVSTAKANFGKS